MLTVVTCLVVCLISSTHALVGKECMTESECDSGECCQILSEFIVVSRQVVDQLPPEILLPGPRKGTCEKYQIEGQSCDGLAKPNGYCGCGPGLTCNMHEVPLPTTVSGSGRSRKDMRPSRPGYHWVSKCEKVNATKTQP